MMKRVLVKAVCLPERLPKFEAWILIKGGVCGGGVVVWLIIVVLIAAICVQSLRYFDLADNMNLSRLYNRYWIYEGSIHI